MVCWRLNHELIARLKPPAQLLSASENTRPEELQTASADVSGGTSVAVDTRSADAWAAGGSSSHGSPGPADLPAWDARALRHWTASSSAVSARLLTPSHQHQAQEQGRAVSTPDPEAWEWTEAAQRAYWRQI